MNSNLAQGDRLSSGSCHYEVLAVLGQGCFGEVAKCRNAVTDEDVAIKVFFNSPHSAVINDEVFILEKLRSLDPDQCHVVKWYNYFQDQLKYCLVFELLDISLAAIMEERNCVPLPVMDIHRITQQMATALNALKTIGVIHCDMKPDNIMVTNRYQRPLNVKLIGFGLALTTSEAKPGLNVQPTGFEAPEIVHHLPFSEAIDMWSLGCILSVLGLGFTDDGRMEDEEDDEEEEDEELGFSGLDIQYTDDGRMFHVGRDLVVNENSACGAFADLLKQMLHLIASERITPSGVLGHRFITMTTDDFRRDRFHVRISDDLQSILEVEDDDDLQSILEVEDDDRVRSTRVPPVAPTVKAWSELEEDKRNFSFRFGLFPIEEEEEDEEEEEEVEELAWMLDTSRAMNSLSKEFFLPADGQLTNLAQADVLSSGSCHYEVLAVLGQGCFGEVAKCRNAVTDEDVAIKVFFNSPHSIDDANDEVFILEKLRSLDPDQCHVVKWYNYFQDQLKYCLVFELLDISLAAIMEERNCVPLPVMDIHRITQQMATALNALKTIGVIHCDMKPDNIMVTNRYQRPLNVKLIGFGLALTTYEAKPGLNVQPTGFEAPEIVHHLPFSEAIDMWSLGCILSVLGLGFSGLDIQYTDDGRMFHVGRDLVVNENSACGAFADLLKQMLHLIASERITPSGVLGHRFITMTTDDFRRDRFHVRISDDLQSILEVEDDDDLQSILEVEDDDDLQSILEVEDDDDLQSILEVEDDDDLQSILEVEDDDRVEDEEDDEDEEDEEYDEDTSRGSSVNTFPDLTPDASAEPPSVAASDCEDTEDVSPTVKAWSEEEDKRKFSCGLFPKVLHLNEEEEEDEEEEELAWMLDTSRGSAASDCAAEDLCGLFPKCWCVSIGSAEHDMVQPPEEKRRKGFFRFLRELCPKRSTRVQPVEKKLSFKNKVKAFFSKAKKPS